MPHEKLARHRRPCVYVAGSMRSGTTWLGMLLAERSGYVFLGEVSGALAESLQQRDCACGCRITCCPTWGPALDQGVARSSAANSSALAASLAESLRTKNILGNEVSHRLPGRGRWSRDLAVLERIVSTAVTASGRNGFVDTSKRMGILQLHLHAGHETRIVHIVRNPWDVARSDKATMPQRDGTVLDPPGQSPARSAARWSWINLFTASCLGVVRAPSEVVIYEDLRADASTVAARTLAALGVEEPEPRLELANHAAVGNPTRFATTSTQAISTEGLTVLTALEALTVRVLSAPGRWWLLARHGYRYTQPR